MTTQKKRPANQKGGKGAAQRPTRAQRVAATQAAPSAAVNDGALGLDLAIDLEDAEVEETVIEVAPPMRAAAAAPEAALAGYGSVAAAVQPQRRGALPARARGRAATKVYALTREQEYAYIQEDMRRLLVIAGILLLLMIALLFLVER